MDKIQQLLDKTNKEVENDYKNNPLMIKVGHFVSVNDTGVYKVVKFTKDKSKCFAVVNLIISEAGNWVMKNKPATVEVSKMKPIVTLLPIIRDRITAAQKIEEFIIENIKNPNLYQKFNNIGKQIEF